MSIKQQQSLTAGKVQYVTIDEDQAGQRIDNFLINHFKTVPKSHIYKMIRKGEVRVNKGRVNAFYKLMRDDSVRLPPAKITQVNKMPKTIPEHLLVQLKQRVLYEDDNLMVIDKPAGFAVHGGSTIGYGIIDALKRLYPQVKNLELAHRLDTETSGCLIIAKKKKILRELHELLREGKVNKIYWTLTKGRWKKTELYVDAPLHKHYQHGGKHVVEVRREGKSAQSLFRTLNIFQGASFMEVKLLTGRTHQIRVHAKHVDHPIAGDDRYGDNEFNKLVKGMGLKRMFLHARSIDFILPSTQKKIAVTAPLDQELQSVIGAFKNQEE